MSSSPAEVLDRVVSDLDGLVRADVVAGLSDDEKMQVLRAVGELQRLAEAVVVETVASVDARPAGSGEVTFCSRFGCRNMSELLQRVLRTDAAGASRVVRAAKVVHRETEFTTGAFLPARWPGLRQALLDGVVGVAGCWRRRGRSSRQAPGSGWRTGCWRMRSWRASRAGSM